MNFLKKDRPEMDLKNGAKLTQMDKTYEWVAKMSKIDYKWVRIGNQKDLQRI